MKRHPISLTLIACLVLLSGVGFVAAQQPTSLLGQAQPLWSFVPPGSKGHLDFGELFPYNPDYARALLKEAGFDEKNPLRYTMMTHSAEAALPTIATILKTQYAKIGVETLVEVLDRPIFLRRLVKDRFETTWLEKP
jgi:ABC-type transport system substrate-binding protein